MTENSENTVKPLSIGMSRLLLLASGLVFIIGIPLFVFSGRTESFFAWTIEPPLTAAFLGAAYWSSFILELLSSREKYWAHARIAVPAVLLFTSLMLLVSIMHIDQFHLGQGFSWQAQLVTWVWLIVYAVVPVIMALLWFLQRRTAGKEPARTLLLPLWMRWLLVLQACIMLLFGVALLVDPVGISERFWPWSLAPVSGRAIAAWLLGLALAAFHMVIENDMLRARSALLAYTALGVLQLTSLVRFAKDRYPAEIDPFFETYGLDIAERQGHTVIAWGAVNIWMYLLFLLSILIVGLIGTGLSWRWRKV